MALRHLGFVDLPPHTKAGGFDHAAVHEPTGRIYVAHTANDAVDVIDIADQRDSKGIDGWTTVTGQWAVEEMAGAPSGNKALVQRSLQHHMPTSTSR